MNEYLTHGGSEFGTSPYAYFTDISVYDEEVRKARHALNYSGASQIVFWWIGEHPEAKFVDQEGCDFQDTEVGWEGPHLRVTPGEASLVWQPRDSTEELWIEWELPKEQS